MDQIEQALRQIALSFAEGDWRAVKNGAQQILKDDPDNSKAVHFLDMAR